MNTNVNVPQGEDNVTVELTLKEAMALSGYRFNQNSKQLAVARRKLKKAVNNQFMSEAEAPIPYEELTH